MLTFQNTYPVELRTAFKSDRNLIMKIRDLCSASYVTTTELIEREIAHNRDIYTISDENEELLAFFMVNREYLDGEESYYLGLGVCRDDMKGQGLGKSLFRRFFKDCRKMEKTENKRFLLWWTTATPIIYYWFNKYADAVEPDMNGNYTEKGKDLVLRIIEEKFPDAALDEQHPFILRAIAQNTIYSSAEQLRLLAAAKSLNVSVFEKFSVREENADRFLMIGYAPD